MPQLRHLAAQLPLLVTPAVAAASTAADLAMLRLPV
jgi:hypothetical protein